MEERGGGYRGGSAATSPVSEESGLMAGDGRRPDLEHVKEVTANVSRVIDASDICSRRLWAAVRRARLLVDFSTARRVVLDPPWMCRSRVVSPIASSTKRACSVMLAPSKVGKGIANVTVYTSPDILFHSKPENKKHDFQKKKGATHTRTPATQ